MEQPMITDWIQAIGNFIGIPVAIWSIILLFRKDKEKERQLESLSNIATSQNRVVSKLAEQVEQLTIQSNHFQYQNSLMADANILKEKQIELQYEIFNHGKGIEVQKVELETRKRLSEIKPYFLNNESMSSPGEFKVYFENRGGEAKKIKIVGIETQFVLFKPLPANLNIAKLGRFELSGGPNSNNTYFNGNNATLEINIEFEDIDGNVYFQNIKRLQTGKYIITDPEITAKHLE